MECGVFDLNMIGAVYSMYECILTLFTSALILALVFWNCVCICARITLRILNIPATTRYFYVRTQFFFSAIMLGLAFNVLPSGFLLLVWDWTVDQLKDGLTINVTTRLLYVYNSAILCLLLLFLKSVMLSSACRCWKPVFIRSWVCEGCRCCFVSIFI